MQAVCLALCCAASLAAATRAQSPDEHTLPDPKLPPPRSYTVECYVVLVRARAAVALVPELSDDARAAAGWTKLQALIARGEATLENLLSGKGTEGRSITTESMEENRYASNPDLPALPWPLPANPRSLELLKWWPYVGLFPRFFDTRNVGPIFTAKIHRTTEPKLLECGWVFNHAGIEQSRQFDAGALANGERLTYTLTDYTSLQNQISLLVESGRPKLAGLHRLPGSDAMVELVIVTVTASPSPSR